MRGKLVRGSKTGGLGDRRTRRLHEKKKSTPRSEGSEESKQKVDLKSNAQGTAQRRLLPWSFEALFARLKRLNEMNSGVVTPPDAFVRVAAGTVL